MLKVSYINNFIHLLPHNYFFYAAALALAAAAIFLLVLIMKSDMSAIPPIRASAGNLKSQTGSKKKW